MNLSPKYLLVEPKIKAVAPNIALMKFARWCELHDHDYQYVRGIVHPKNHWMYCVGSNGSENSVQNGIIESWQPVLVYYKLIGVFQL